MENKLNFTEQVDKTLICHNTEINKAFHVMTDAEKAKELFENNIVRFDVNRINECFNKLKLNATIESVNTKGNSLEIRATIQPGSQVKPVKEDYRGFDKIKKPLYERTARLKDKINELTGLRTSINEFSFIQDMRKNETIDNVRLMITLNLV
jgi:hypothetical protein